MAAERACELSEKPARVVAATSQQASLLALIELDPALPAADNAARLEESLAGVATGGVAPAARDDAQGRFKKGDAVGFAAGEIVAWGGAGTTLTKTIQHLAEGAEIVTVIAGDGAPIALSEIDTHAPAGSRSRPTRGDSRAGGGCSRRSKQAGGAGRAAARRRAPLRRERTPGPRAELRDAPVHWPRPSALDVSIRALDGVGPKLAEAAAEAGIHTVWDLLLRFPHRHRSRQVRQLGSLATGETGTVLVEVLAATKPRPFRKGRLSILGVKVGDESGHARATWFNQPWVADKLEPGAELLLTGKLSGKGFAVHEWELVSAGGEVEDSAFVPVHAATEALRPQRIREWVEQAVARAPNAVEGLPAALRARRGLGGVGDAIQRRPLPGDRRGARGRAAAARLRGALPPPGAARLAQTQPPGGAAGAALRPRRRARRPLARLAPVRADRRPARRLRRPRRRPRLGRADGPPLDGRGRLGEDRGRGLRDAAGARSRLPGGADGADRDPRRAARDHPRAAAGGGGDPVRAAHRGDPGGEPPTRPEPARERRARADRRDPRADRADRALRPPRRGRRRRAAPLRGRAAPGARLEGGRGARPARPPHDRDADPAHPLADRLRRPRHHRAPPAPGRAPADRDPAGRGGAARRSLRVHAAAAARGAAGLRRLPAGLRIGENDRAGGGGRGRAAAQGRAARLPGRPPPRPDALEREGRGDARLRRRRDRRAGGDDGDRGRDRRRQRDRDGDRGGRALRRLPAPPAARPGRPRRASLAVLALHRTGGGDGAAAADRRSRGSRTASSWPRSTWRCAARARSSAPASRARPASRSPSCPTTRQLLFEAKDEVLELLDRYGSLEDPALGPLLEAARRRFGAGAADPIPL